MTGQKWRLMVMGANNGFYNMALDEALMESPAPLLRMYPWKPPAVTIGYFQKAQEEVDIPACRELGVDVVRRQTGGGAVFHEHELTYCVVMRDFPQNVLDSYRDICGAVVEGLGTIGIRAEFAPLNDIVVNGKKISGCAQTRRKGVLLQHGTILLDVDVEKMFKILLVPSEKMRGKLISDVKQRVAPLGIPFSQAAEAIKRGFEIKMNADFESGAPTETEGAQARQLELEKYRTEEWLYRV